MIENFFSEARALERCRAMPLGVYIEDFTEWLNSSGYSYFVIRFKIGALFRINEWLIRVNADFVNVESWNLPGYFSKRKQIPRNRRKEEYTARQFVMYLRDRGVLVPEKPAAKESWESLLSAYESYLREERGLSKITRDRYLDCVEEFVRDLGLEKHSKSIRRLKAQEIQDYIGRNLKIRRSNWRFLLLTRSLRSFLRYLHVSNQSLSDLSGCLLGARSNQVRLLPRSLPVEVAERVIRGCRRDTPRGKRDYAILLLLARLGLRAGEIVRLELGDLCWADGTIDLRRKLGRVQRLPLAQDVGNALVYYLKYARPKSKSRRFFLCLNAPVRPIAGPSAVCAIVAQALRGANVEGGRRGAHIFRHTLACNLLKRGACLEEIAQVLGHQHPDTTAIYARVDVESLRLLTPEWLGGHQ